MTTIHHGGEDWCWHRSDGHTPPPLFAGANLLPLSYTRWKHCGRPGAPTPWIQHGSSGRMTKGARLDGPSTCVAEAQLDPILGDRSSVGSRLGELAPAPTPALGAVRPSTPWRCSPAWLSPQQQSLKARLSPLQTPYFRHDSKRASPGKLHISFCFRPFPIFSSVAHRLPPKDPAPLHHPPSVNNVVVSRPFSLSMNPVTAGVISPSLWQAPEGLGHLVQREILPLNHMEGPRTLGVMMVKKPP
jgi:hypothetical protein